MAYNNYFDQIYQAALKQNPEMLPPKGTYTIDDFKEGHAGGTSAAAQLAKEGNFDAVEWLIEQGAIKNYAAYGAGFGGHVDFAEKLIQQGAGISSVARGAAQGGHIEFAETLLQRGANIDLTAQGAATGGHFDFAEKLLQRGAEIIGIACGATFGGHVEFVEKLLKQGADIDLVAATASLSKQVDTEQKQLAFLSTFTRKTRRQELVDTLASLEEHSRQIEPSVAKRAGHIAELRHNFAYPYSLALASTQAVTLQASDDTSTTRTNTGALVMLAAAAYFQNRYPLPKKENGQEIQIALPPEIWHGIFKFVFECELSQEDFHQLGFLTGRLILLNQVSDCQEDDALKKEILKRTNVRELREFVSSKTECDDNDAASTSMSTSVQTIFSDWQKCLTTNEEDAASSIAPVTPA